MLQTSPRPSSKKEREKGESIWWLHFFILEEAREEALCRVLPVGKISLARLKWARCRPLSEALLAGKIRGMESSTSNAAENKGLPMVRAKTTASSTTIGFDAELWLTSDTRRRIRDISTFPFDPREMSADALKLLGALGRDYVKDLKLNAEKAVRADKGTKAVECLSFRVNQSKTIPDEIDTVLAGHYGFTAEELDLEDLWPTK